MHPYINGHRFFFSYPLHDFICECHLCAHVHAHSRARCVHIVGRSRVHKASHTHIVSQYTRIVSKQQTPCKATMSLNSKDREIVKIFFAKIGPRGADIGAEALAR